MSILRKVLLGNGTKRVTKVMKLAVGFCPIIQYLISTSQTKCELYLIVRLSVEENRLTLSLPRSSTDDLGFSVFTSNFFKLSYKISLIKNRFVTLFFIRFS